MRSAPCWYCPLLFFSPLFSLFTASDRQIETMGLLKYIILDSPLFIYWQGDYHWQLFGGYFVKNRAEKNGNQNIESCPHRSKKPSRWRPRRLIELLIPIICLHILIFYYIATNRALPSTHKTNLSPDFLSL